MKHRVGRSSWHSLDRRLASWRLGSLALCLCVLVGIVLAGCSAQQTTAQPPEDVAREFVRAVVEDDGPAASAAAGYQVSPADLKDFRVAWTGQDKPGVFESVAWQSGAMGNDTRMYGIVSLEVAEIDIPATQFDEGTHQVVLGLKAGRWRVVMAE